MSTHPHPGTYRVTPAGTLCTPEGAVIPLLSVDLEIDVRDTLASLELRQVYRNVERQPIEAIYSFPIPESSAPNRVEVRIGDRLIRTVIEEKEAGTAHFDEAVAAGRAAVLVGADRSNILSLSLGNLRPGEQAVVTIGLAMELETNGNEGRLLVPTTIAPRYVSATEASTIDPAELDALLPPFLADVPVGLRMRATFEGSSPITEVACHSHPMRTEFQDGRALVSFSQDDVPLDQDIVITVRHAEAPGSTALTARDGDDACAVALTFHEPDAAETRQASEVVFLIDRSGSMQGESIEQARRTLQLCLRVAGRRGSLQHPRLRGAARYRSFRSRWPTTRSRWTRHHGMSSNSTPTSGAPRC
jgi:Ca-activated chloride channel family protein